MVGAEKRHPAALIELQVPLYAAAQLAIATTKSQDGLFTWMIARSSGARRLTMYQG